MQPELAVLAPLTLIGKGGAGNGHGGSRPDVGGEPFVAWGSPVPRVVTSHCLELGSPTAAQGPVLGPSCP